MVTSSAVVGSSATSSAGPVQQRDGDRDALAHAARELVRIGVEPLLGGGDADAQRAPRRARSRAALSDTRSCARIASIICVSMRRTGFSVVIGSWKIMARRRPRKRAQLLLRPADQLCAVEHDRAASDPSRRVDQAEDGKPGDRSCPSPIRRRAPAPRRGRRSKETPLTAVSTPSRVPNVTTRSRTARMGVASPRAASG